MIQDPTKDLTLIVYNTPKPPKYIKINKGLVKSLLFIIPFMVIVSVAFSLFTSFYMKRKLEAAQSQEPKKITALKHQAAKLSAQIDSLQKSNQELTEKISTGSAATGVAASQLALFNTPLGFEDLRDKNFAKIDNFSNQMINGKVTFKFDLINNQQNSKKLSGYITIVQYHSYGISLYPNISLNNKTPLIQYNKGESFHVSRFRPVIAEFSVPQNSASVWYKIFIFSRTGNLLAMESSEEYPLN
jgi:hypothetical protein